MNVIPFVIHTDSKTQLLAFRTNCAIRLIPLPLLLAPPAALQAQFTYTNNSDGTATITGYTGPGGDVAIARSRT